MWELLFLGKMMTIFVIDNGKYELIIWFTYMLGCCFQILLQHFKRSGNAVLALAMLNFSCPIRKVL